MSQSFHQHGFHGFSNGYERSLSTMNKQGDQYCWIMNNNQRDMFRVQGIFHDDQQAHQELPPQPLLQDAAHVFDHTGSGRGAGMLTEVVDFSRGVIKTAAVDDNDNDVVLNHDQIQSSYRWSLKQPVTMLNEDDELPLMHHNIHDGYHHHNIEGQVLSLSLSSSMSTNLESATKFQELRTGGAGGGGAGGVGGGLCFFDPGLIGTGSSSSSSLNFFGYNNNNRNVLENSIAVGANQDHHHQIGAGEVLLHLGLPAAASTTSRMRNSLYLKAAQELLEEFCCVGRGQYFKNIVRTPSLKLMKGSHIDKVVDGSPNNNGGDGGGCSGGGGSSVLSASSKESHPLSASERAEYQRRKAKLLSMLDEVDGRYTNYCDKMQRIVNTFDSVMGHGSAAPYTILAQKAMSRHFRNIKDAILGQLKLTCEFLGDKDVTGTIGLTKGETPRLKLLDQKFRQHKSIHQLGMLDPEAWRPQRGLPERSVNLLRAWLFEHFLHPYPSEADKHSLARQTGLSKNQVSNWFINARVRLWKPMVEEIYKQEEMEDSVEETTTEEAAAVPDESKTSEDHKNIVHTQTAMHHHHHRHYNNKTSSSSTTTTATAAALLQGAAAGRRSEINAALENDPSKNTINYGQYSLGNETTVATASVVYVQGNSNITTSTVAAATHHDDDDDDDESMAVYDSFTAIPNPRNTLMHGRRNHQDHCASVMGMRSTQVTARAAATALVGDHVSLTLGLQHSENVLPKKRDDFSIRNFGTY